MLSRLLLRRRDPATPRPIALVLFAIALIVPLVGAIVAQPARPALANSATTTTALNLRSGPSMGHSVLTVMPGGASVEITGSAQSGWYPVTYNGTDGWAYGDFLSAGGSSTAGASATGTASTTVRLNLRSGPSLDHSVVTVMPVGASVTLTGNSSNGFVSVTYNGMSGWAYADFLGSGGGSAAPPASNDGGSGEAASVTVNLNLRSGPSLGDPVITVIPAGAGITVTGNSSNGFVSVTYSGNSGWAYSDFITFGSAGNSAGNDGGGNSGAVVGSACATVNLNLRAGASTSTAVLTVIPAAETVSVTGNAQSGFHPVTYGGQSGWAASNFLNFDGNCTVAPAPNPGSGDGNSDIISIIYAAADRYGQSREDMLRVARCESNLIPTARNPSSGASGLFQFMPGTWATTPYADHDIFDAWASANAAGWMWSVGRRNEWVCQ